MQWISLEESDLMAIAQELIQLHPGQKKWALHGEMGVGKTTFIKALCKSLKVVDVVKSPTYSIVNEYLSKQNETIYHFDFYRLEKESEAFDIGYESYFYGKDYCFVEWPDKISNLIDNSFWYIDMVLENGRRIIKLRSNG
jgi:tRNA threonylcarbamoyladenosine biosynthesis protein TsaE